MATAVTTDGTPQAPPGKKLCPHTCSCIVKYSSKERGRSALSTRGAAYWDHIKNVNVHPDCSPQCPGHPLLRGDNKEPPIKKQRMLGFGEMEGEWGYTNMWQGPPPTGSGSEARDRESRDMEGLTMDTKSDINRWISGGSRPFVYTAASDTIPTPLRSYSSFIETYANELGIVLQFQRVPQPRNSNLPLSTSPSISSIPSTPANLSVATPSTPGASSTAPSPSSISEQSPVSSSPSTPSENSLIALSTTALSTDSTPNASSPSLTSSNDATSQLSTGTIDASSPIATPVSSSSLTNSPPSSPPPSSHSTGSSWVFVKALEQRWDVKTWAEWYNKESTKKKHKIAYYLVNIPVRAEDHTIFKKDPVTAMLSHRGTLCLNQYINIFDEYLPIPDMDAKLFLAPPWTGAVLTPPCIDRNRTQSLHRVIFGDGLNLVHIWEKLTEDQESRFRKVIGLPDTHDRQLHPFQLKYTVDDSTEVWDRSKEEELQKWGILSNRIELMPGQTLIVPLDMPHVMKKLGPIPASSQHALVPHSSATSTTSFSLHPNHATIINHAAPPSHSPHSHSHPHSHHQHPPNSHPHSQPHSHSIPLPSFSPLVHTPIVTPSSHVSAIIAPPPTSPSPIVVPPNFHHHVNSTGGTAPLHAPVSAQLTNPASQTTFISFANSYQGPSTSNNVQPSNFTSYNTPTTSFTTSSSFPSTTTPSTTSTYTSSNPNFPATSFASSPANTNFQSNFPPTASFSYTNAPYNSTQASTTNFNTTNSTYPPTYANPLVVNYNAPATTPTNNATPGYNSNFNFLSQPTLPSSTTASSQAPLSYPTSTAYSSTTYPPKVSPYPPATYQTNFSNYSSTAKLPANAPAITPIHMNKAPSTSGSYALSNFPIAQPKMSITSSVLPPTSNFAPSFTQSEDVLMSKGSVKETELPKENNTNNNNANVLDLSFGGMNSSMTNLSTSMTSLNSINNIINNMTNDNENNEHAMEIDHTNTPIPIPTPIPSTPQANEKDDIHANSENDSFSMDDHNGDVAVPNSSTNGSDTLQNPTQMGEVTSQESVVSTGSESTRPNDTSSSGNPDDAQLPTPEGVKLSEQTTLPQDSTEQRTSDASLPSTSSDSASSTPSSSSSSSPSVTSSPSASLSSSPSASSSSSSLSTTSSSTSSTSPSSSSSTSSPSSSSATSNSSSSSTSSSTSSTSTASQNFPVPLLTYSGECSFVGTTRESFARNVDLMKYWHKQLRKDHQPVSVHVELALYCLIHYVLSSPNPLTLLHENTLLCEHFIGAIPHFKEFVADEGERLTRYQARIPNTIHIMLKKEARTDWVCRKCKCHLTNFLIRYNNTSKNEASCFECWEDELDLDASNNINAINATANNNNNTNNNNNNKKDDKKRKEKKKETKGKRNSQKGEGVFRFGHVDALVSLANKASKLVLKL